MIYYLISINILLFLLFGIDKHKAKKNKWRISESTLLIIGLIGAPIGGILGIKVWKHKTKKKYFMITYILTLLVYSYLIINFIWR